MADSDTLTGGAPNDTAAGAETAETLAGGGADTVESVELTVGGDGDSITVDEVAAPSVEAYDPSKDREKIRGQIALILVWTLVGVVAFAVFTSWIVMPEENRSALLDVIEAVLPPLIALVGAVTGFYFGEKSK